MKAVYMHERRMSKSRTEKHTRSATNFATSYQMVKRTKSKRDCVKQVRLAGPILPYDAVKSVCDMDSRFRFERLEAFDVDDTEAERRVAVVLAATVERSPVSV